MILVTFISLYTVRIVVDVLGVEDYGLYNLLVSTILIFGFLKNTLVLSVQRYLSFELGNKEQTNLKSVFSTALLIHFCLALLIFIIGETIGLYVVVEYLNIPVNRLNSSIWAYHFALITSLISIVQVPFNAVIISRENMSFYAVIAVFEVILKLITVYSLYSLDYDSLILYSFSLFLISFLVLSCYYIYTRKRFEEVRISLSFDKKILKSFLNFSGWASISSLGTLISRDGIVIILNIFFGPIAVASRAISLQISKGLNQFIFGLQTASNPQIVKLYASGNNKEMISLVNRNSKFAFLLLWILCLPVLINLDYILNLWLIEIPEYTFIFCKITFIHALITSFRRPFLTAVQSTGEIKSVSIKTGLIMVSVIPFSYLFYKFHFPIYTPLIIHIIAVITCFVVELNFLFKRKEIDFSIYFIIINAFKLLMLVILSYLLSFYVKGSFSEINFYSFTIISFITIIIISVFTYFLILDDWEKKKLGSIKSIFKSTLNMDNK